MQPTRVFLISIMLFAIGVNAQQLKNDNYIINGTVKGIDTGIIRMISADGNNTLDSSVISKSKFVLRGKISEPQQLLFNVSPGNWNFKAFVEDNAITFFVDTAGAVHYGKGNNTWALIWEIKETGSKFADVYAKYIKEINQKRYHSIINSLHTKLKAAEGNANETSLVTNKIDAVMDVVYKRQKAWIEHYIHQYPSSVYGVYLFNDYYQSLPGTNESYLDSILNIFSEDARTSIYYRTLANTATDLKNVRVNNLAPDFTLRQRDSAAFTLSSTRGNYVLIDFWASWCAPCRKAIPGWKNIYNQYTQKGLVIVSVSDDREWSDWIKSLDKEQMAWIQVIDEFPDKNKPAIVSELFGVKLLPSYFLLDKDGKVIISSAEENTIRNKIEEILQ